MSTLIKGRNAFRQHAWTDAYTFLSSANKEASLQGDDLERLAQATYLIGKESESTANWSKAHHSFLDQGQTTKAAYCAFWLGMKLLNEGDRAQGSGWIARAGRLLTGYDQECVEKGFLLIPKALQNLSSGNAEQAYNLFHQAAAIGERFDNADLLTLSRLGRGQALIKQKKIDEGTELLDESMVAVVTDEVSPIVTGIVYCAVIETCQKIYDLRRAHEWTDALNHWCESQPDLVPYRSQCMVRRAEIMQLHGKWEDAMNEIGRIFDHLPDSSKESAIGAAFYRKAELYRLQGRYSEAEEAYRQTSKWGRNPQPGLALLRLAQDRIDTAIATIQQLEKERQNPIDRSEILPAYIDILLEANDLAIAETVINELTEIAVDLHAPFLRAIANRAQGRFLLSKGEPSNALAKLQKAKKQFSNIEAAYESALSRIFIGLACRDLGDIDTSNLELEAAKWTLNRLGAAPDVARILSLLGTTDKGSHGLTQRELQVLRILSTGKTNREIAADLFISERTVDRHVSNIFAKLQVSSRTAATAYAYEHDLI